MENGMQFFSVNRKALGKHNPRLAEMLERAGLQGGPLPGTGRAEEGFEVRSEPARDGDLCLVVTKGTDRVRMNSNYHPAEEASRWADAQAATEGRMLYYLFGLGNGICLKQLLAKLSPEEQVMVWEPEPAVFYHVLQQYDLQQPLADERVTVFVEGLNEQDVYAWLDRKIHWSNAGRQKLLVHPQYDRVFALRLKAFQQLISNNNIRVYTNRNTEMFFGRSIARNTAINMRFAAGAGLASELAGKFPAQLPAIVISAGPSLDKNIEELRRAKGKAFLLATDTALRALLAHDILPDAAVILDADKPVSYFAEPRSHQIPLFAKVQARAEILQLQTAPILWFDSHEYLNRFYRGISREIRDYHAGASVATGAFSICAALGFHRIILVGQDLAYAGEITHAGGEISSILAEEEDVRYVESVDGGTVKTRHDWYQYLLWFERVIREVAGEIEVIDATEGGARIHGTKLLSLSETIDRYCHTGYDFSGLLEKNCKGLTGKECTSLSEYLNKSLQEAEQLDSWAGEIAAVCRRALEDGTDKASCEEQRKQLQDRLQYVQQQMAEMDFFLLADDYTKKLTIPAITELMEPKGSRQEENHCYFSQNLTIYQAFQDAVQALAPELAQVLAEIREHTDRQEETLC